MSAIATQTRQVVHEVRGAQSPGLVLWLTGLSGAGKSTLAQAAADRLRKRGSLVSVLDGDDLRQGLSRDLGFSDADRAEQGRRAAHVARLLSDLGVVVIVALISPLRSLREQARDIVGSACFREVFVRAPLNLCEQRDPKGLYRRARAGSVRAMTGVDAAYEPPDSPALVVDTSTSTIDDGVAGILEVLGQGQTPQPEPVNDSERANC